jgi:hypothetical protein
MKLKDIKKLTDVSKEYNIPIRTLQDRLNRLVEGEDYMRLGKRMPTILTPTGVEKIIK